MTGGTTSKSFLQRGSSETQKTPATMAARKPKTPMGSVISAVVSGSMGSVQPESVPWPVGCARKEASTSFVPYYGP